ncbi:hypothetical protein B0G74_7882 [Paraburkholderia sp. BL9I2N2]|nr:hypothetical protein B0G74_7882 [Paraburkholderia sp. BL9I2N2]
MTPTLIVLALAAGLWIVGRLLDGGGSDVLR